MSKGYLIGHATVTDPTKWSEYVAKSNIAIAKYAGKPLARGGRHTAIEGEGSPRNIIIEFESYEAALRYANSAEYADAKTLRQGAGSMNMVVVEGCKTASMDSTQHD